MRFRLSILKSSKAIQERYKSVFKSTRFRWKRSVYWRGRKALTGIEMYAFWGNKGGAVVRALASHHCGLVQILVSTAYVGWNCCWFSPLLWAVFHRILRFSPLLKNQHFQIPIRSGTHGHVSTSSHELLSAPWVTNYNYNNRKRIRMDEASEAFEFPASVFSGPLENEEFLSTCMPMFYGIFRNFFQQRLVGVFLWPLY